MYSSEEIIKDEAFQDFLKNNKKIKSGTINGYVKAVKGFCNSSGKSPAEIVEICKDELRNNVPEFDQWILTSLKGFKSDMEGRGLKPSTIALNIGTCKSFLRDFHVNPLPDIKLEGRKKDKEPSEYLTKDDIKRAIKYANPVYRTIYTVQSQTGLAIADTVKLTIGDFIKAVSDRDEDLSLNAAINKVKDKKLAIGCLDLTRRKTERRFYTFISYEGLLAIADLLKSRDNNLKHDDFIFLKETYRLPQDMRKKSYNSNELEITTVNAAVYTNRLNKRIFINQKDENGYCYFRTHKIRSWYSNQLYLAGLDWKDIKFLMGQRTGDVLERYVDTNAYKKLKKSYQTALESEYLKLNEIVVIEDTDRVKQVEAELDTQKKHNMEMEERMEKMETLMKEMAQQLTTRQK